MKGEIGTGVSLWTVEVDTRAGMVSRWGQWSAGDKVSPSESKSVGY